MTPQLPIQLVPGAEVEDFISRCECHCMFECCDFNALDLSSGHVRSVVAQMGGERASALRAIMVVQLGELMGKTGKAAFLGHVHPIATIRSFYQESRRAVDAAIFFMESGWEDIPTQEPFENGRIPDGWFTSSSSARNEGFRYFALLEYGVARADSCALRWFPERLAHHFHDAGQPAGTVMLGNWLLSRAFSRTGLENPVGTGKEMLVTACPKLADLERKDDWDWFWLGMAIGNGRGVACDPGKAAGCFRASRMLGNPFAEYEEIWFDYLARCNIVEAVSRFRAMSGPLQVLGLSAADALATAHMGQVCSGDASIDAVRILELNRIRHLDLRHKAGSRAIKSLVRSAMSAGLDKMMAGNELSSVALYLVAVCSPGNPTGIRAEEWLTKSLSPKDRLFPALIRSGYIPKNHLSIISGLCHANGWSGTELQEAAAAAMDESL